MGKLEKTGKSGKKQAFGGRGIGPMSPIGPIHRQGRLALSVFSVALAGGVEAFGEAALGEELLFELVELTVEEVVGLVDQADDGVGGYLGGALFYIGPIEPALSASEWVE